MSTFHSSSPCRALHSYFILTNKIAREKNLGSCSVIYIVLLVELFYGSLRFDIQLLISICWRCDQLRSLLNSIDCSTVQLVTTKIKNNSKRFNFFTGWETCMATKEFMFVVSLKDLILFISTAFRIKVLRTSIGRLAYHRLRNPALSIKLRFQKLSHGVR